jgi:SRSO17 transposase
VLIADETGFEKAGRFSAGTQRQYTGTAGKITNCQVGVFLACAVPAAGVRVLTDRELYVPKSWTDDRERCERAGIGEEVKFATKPEFARKMIGGMIALGLPFAWLTADEAYGDNGKLRDWLERHKISYVVAVSCDHLVPAGAGKTIRADHLAARVPDRAGSGCRAGRGQRASGCMTGRSRPPGQAGTC